MNDKQTELVDHLRRACISLLATAQTIESDPRADTDEMVELIEADIRFIRRSLDKFLVTL